MKAKIIPAILLLSVILFFAFLLKKENNQMSTLPNLPTNDWSIIPDERIGPLARVNISDQQAILPAIQNAFGVENVKEAEFSIGEGENIPGYIIYPDTENEVEVHISDSSVLFKFPGYNSYFFHDSALSSKIEWRMDNNIIVGTPLSLVQEKNGKVFELSGFEWDYPGIVDSWGAGNLPPELSLVFIQTSEETPLQYAQITGDKILFSDNPILQEVKPVVNFFYIKWNI